MKHVIVLLLLAIGIYFVLDKVADLAYEREHPKPNRSVQTPSDVGEKAATETAEEYAQGIREGAKQYNTMVGHPFTPADLFTEFTDNEIAAESKFRGHTLFIVGAISRIETEWTGGARVTFPLGLEGLNSVVCHIDREHMNAFSILHPGSRIEVSGESPSMVMDSVQVQNCSLEYVESGNSSAN